MKLPSPYSPQFHLALANLSANGVDLAHVGHVLQIWHRACAEANPPEPIVVKTGSVAVALAWNTADVYMDVEVYQDGMVEWFYKNRVTRRVDGTDEGLDRELPPMFFECLRSLSVEKRDV